MRVRVRKLESVLEDLEAMRQHVTTRAHQLFRERGGHWGQALDDWLRAEREIMWRPPVELTESDGRLCVAVATPGVDAADLDIRVTPEDVVVSSTSGHDHGDEGATVHACEFTSGRLFRSVRLPHRVEPAAAKADYKNGVLRIVVPIAEPVTRQIVVGHSTSAPAA